MLTIDIHKSDLVSDDNGPWDGQSLYDLYEIAHAHENGMSIINHARKKKLICFSTPFDETAVDF